MKTKISCLINIRDPHILIGELKQYMQNQRYYTTEAIILKRLNYGEADRILTLMTNSHGKMTVIAKGVRKSKSRKRGHVELFNHVKAYIANSRSLPILIEAETIHNFSQPTTSIQQLEPILHAYQYVELIDRLIPEHEPHSEVFDLLSKTLQNIRQSTTSQQLTTTNSYFKHRLIRLLGFWPYDKTAPANINAYLNSILEKPLKTDKIWSALKI